MKSQFFSTFLVVFIVFISIFAITASSGASTASPNMGPSSSSFTGTINITTDGNVVYNGSGNTNVVSVSGNTYTLTGQVYGSINILHNNTVFDGQNYLISNNSYDHNFSINIMNVNHVSLENIYINTPEQPGIFINTSSYDTLGNLNITAAFTDLIIGNYTNHITVSNGVFALNSSIYHISFLLNNIMSGEYFVSNSFMPAKNSNNMAFVNDIINTPPVDYLGTGALISSINNTLNNLTFQGITSYGLQIGGNNTTLSNSTLTGYEQYGIISGPNYAGSLSNIVYRNNIFNLSSETIGPGHPIEAIVSENTNFSAIGNYFNIGHQTSGGGGSLFYGITEANSVSTISNNSIIMNNTGNNIAGGISSEASSVSLSNNKISLINTEQDSNGAVQTTYGTMNASNNTIFYSSSTGTNMGFGFNTQETNFTAYGNDIISQNSDLMGFLATGNNRTDITHNTVNMQGGTGQFGMEVTSVGTNGKLVLTQNKIVQSSASTEMAGIGIRGVDNALVSENAVTQSSATTTLALGLALDGVKNSSIYGNTLSGAGISLTFNVGISTQDLQNSTVSNNTIFNYNSSLNLTSSSNDTFVGNYFNNSYTVLSLNNANYSVFYHNDFMNYRDSNFNISGSSHDQFNAALPVGGNYWQSYRGNDGNGDGIGDSPFTVNGSFVDHYPLMKPWTRPQAVFLAPSGINGTTWKVTFNGQTKQSTGDTIAFNILNGTYQSYKFEYYNSSLYYTNTLNGSLSYNGSGISLNVPYLHYSYITGKLNLTNFTVYINGKLIATTNGAFNLTVTAGNYTVVIEATGYATFNHTYDLTSGETLLVNPNFAKTPSGGFPQIYEYVAAIIAVAAILGAIAAIYMRGKNKK